jgi:hypothetical protein
MQLDVQPFALRRSVLLAFAFVAACGANAPPPSEPRSAQWSQPDQGTRAIADCKQTHNADSAECLAVMTDGRLSLAEQRELRSALDRDQAEANLAMLGFQPCSRRRAEQESTIRSHLAGTVPTANDVNDSWAQCVKRQLQRCQDAVDANIDDGLRQCADVAWNDLPSEMQRPDAVGTVSCLQQAKAEQSALRTCIANTEADQYELRCPTIAGQATCGRTRLAERFRCMNQEPTTLCSLVNVADDWAAFRTANKIDALREEARVAACADQIERTTLAERAGDARRTEGELASAAATCTTDAERTPLAQLNDDVAKLKLAADEKAQKKDLAVKEAMRCGGGTTMAFVMMATAGGRGVPKDTQGCRYVLFGKVRSSNQQFTQLTNFTDDEYAHLIRTNEAFVTGTVFTGDSRVRYATYAGIQRITLADGSSHALHAFKLLP